MTTEEKKQNKKRIKKQLKQEIKKLFKKLASNEPINDKESKLCRYVFDRLTTDGYEEVDYFDEFVCEVMRDLRLS